MKFRFQWGWLGHSAQQLTGGIDDCGFFFFGDGGSGFCLFCFVVVVLGFVCLFVFVCVYYGGWGGKMMSSHLLPTCQVCQIGFTGVGFTPREL